MSWDAMNVIQFSMGWDHVNAEPHLEFPNQGEVEVSGEVESLVGEEDLVGVLASLWLASVGNH